MQYSAHVEFVAPARARPQIWRLLVGLIVAMLIYAFGIGFVFGGIYLVAGYEGMQTWATEMVEATGPTGTLLILATFFGMALGPMLAVVLLHRRSVGSLFGPFPRMVRHFLVAMGVCVLAYGVSFLLPSDLRIEPAMERALWLSFLPMALVGILLQTGAEEVLFRGYLQQQLAARFASPLIWMVLPSALFASLHYQPELMGDNALYVVAATGLFGLLAADLTARTGSIGAAWGFHFANNVVAILIVALDGPLSGLALYTAPLSAASEEIRPLILLDMGTTVVTWVLIRLAVTRA
ncbi:CPBP family intramembrane metalloprotease [Rhodobacteraceae bacterium N5(2021)]|uniref:CPBP family intramembrane metalloprotease n=1 Tax=Gymnodinialimonas phycosphaerae TaxID=2841589 RepID=A0A975TT81_9RHOB|nr:CPBP family intramembrane glutamic endopeptidase [Gymnodinialimonas phycosphaerae]MBY4894147.1 CPBP family intramembrane metalloprotease [Gymnodinialimonas phycosphaerae]